LLEGEENKKNYPDDLRPGRSHAVHPYIINGGGWRPIREGSQGGIFPTTRGKNEFSLSFALKKKKRNKKKNPHRTTKSQNQNGSGFALTTDHGSQEGDYRSALVLNGNRKITA